MHTIQQLKNRPTILITTGLLLLLGALIVPIVSNVICLACSNSPLYLAGLVCLNLWVIFAPLGLLMLTCGVLGEYCQMRKINS